MAQITPNAKRDDMAVSATVTFALGDMTKTITAVGTATRTKEVDVYAFVNLRVGFGAMILDGEHSDAILSDY